MANMGEVNKTVRKAYPDLGVEAQRVYGAGYVYIVSDKFPELEFASVFSNPPTTPTDAMTDMVLSSIKETLTEEK